MSDFRIINFSKQLAINNISQLIKAKETNQGSTYL